ncbi:hypothetical protein QBC47DRAFT_393206 [Echria macrotheca]|uniref:Negative regulator of differentiation 1 n=1 Tax=Echria macrotheca TaxID=438768 RepID=A0AAJ0B3S1_9PEZI|nr:hypothetical protein QBC47DRAFT_393206 [Echria macrotheca]
MASAASSQVTIPREYFDTLVRRARFNSESFENSGFAPTVVTIPQNEYAGLCTAAKKYENLRRSLMLGGIESETIEVLSQDRGDVAGASAAEPDPAYTETAETIQTTEDGGVSLHTYTPQPSATPFYPQHQSKPATGGNGGGYHGVQSHEPAGWAEDDVEADDDTSCAGDLAVNGVVGATYAKPQTQRSQAQYERQCARTVQLSNLAEGTTHADIINAVRGGMLLEVFVRSNERSASVSFLHSSSAKAFLEHVRKHDLYIRNKRIEVKWHDRQFVLPGHVASKISQGASRNLIIRRYDGRHTDESIREDLEHIHNLVVVKTEFTGGNCHVSLNSVYTAIFARMCMMSRSKYKGTKIDWDVDECAQPYAMPSPRARKVAIPNRKAATAISNRFQLLNLEDDEEDEGPPAFCAETVGIAA